ncbi:MAG: aromatic ring-hydroxylating dioxygenase subunit alpha [Candidatus Eremiobacterota bacterium]
MLIRDWHPVARSSDVAPVAPARLLGEDLVLWRSEAGVNAWRDLCLHRGTRLSLGRVERGRLVCAYHGWAYEPGGRCVEIPAHPGQPPPEKACARAYGCREERGLVWVCLGEPHGEPPSMPEWSDPAFRTIMCGPYPFHAAAPRVMENFLDVAHLPIVHEGLLGTLERPEIAPYTVETGEEGLTARGIRLFQPDPDGTGRCAEVTYTYRVLRPLWGWLSKQMGFTLCLGVCPVDQVESLAFMLLSMSYAHDRSEEELRAFQDRIVAQDRPVVESQRPELLPLDLAAELHLRSDQTAIAYRTWIRKLGVGFGTV